MPLLNKKEQIGGVTRMKKLFISQPMRDKTDEEILAEREKAVKVAKEMLNEDVEVIDSFFWEAPHDAPHWYLVGRSLEYLLQQTSLSFAPDGKWIQGAELNIYVPTNMVFESLEKWILKKTIR